MASVSDRGVSFSIVTPVLNAVHTIERTLESVAAQALPAEHIVLDAGSCDGTVAVLEAWSDRLAFWRSAADGGIAAAFNEGIGRATGDFVCFLNADDFLLSDALDIVHAAVVRCPAADIIYGDAEILDLNGNRFVERSDLGRLPQCMSLYHPSLFFRRELFDRIGAYDERFDLAMDSELVHRALASGAGFEAVHAPLAVMSRGGLSDRHHWRSLRQYRQSLRMHGLQGGARSAYHMLRQFCVHEALKFGWVKRWRLNRRQTGS